MTAYRFDQIAENIRVPVMPSDTDLDRYVGLEHLDPESLKLRRWGNPSEVIGQKLRFWKGDIIYGKRRAYQRKLAVADFDGICSAHAFVLRAKPDACLPEFFPFFLQSELFHQRALEISVGSLSPTINWSALAKQEFPLPPVNEQRRIADLLWTAENAIIEYQNVIEKILQTKDIFIANALTSNRPFRTLEEFIQNSQWKMEKLEHVCLQITDGTHVTPEYVSQGIPFLRVTDIQDTLIDWKTVKYIKPEVHEQYIKRCHPQKGDVLLSKNGTIGLVKVVDWDEPFSIFVSLCILKPDTHLNPYYLAEIIRSRIVQMQFSKRAKQGTVTNLHLEEIRECLIPFPSLSEQEEFVSKSKQFDDTYKQAVTHLENTKNLKKSLLTEFLE